jgi:DNA primase
MASNLKEAAVLIKQRMSIVDFFMKRGFDVKKSGNMRYVALCPFHSERTPSFSINEASSFYHCFGCGKSGDMFTYLEEKENLSFPEAVELLAGELGITIDQNPDDKEKAINRKRLLSILNATAKFFWQQYNALPETHPAKKQVTSRNIPSSNKENYNLFGWAPENSHALMDHLHSLGFKDDDMVQAGAIRRSEKGDLYVLWRGRLMFPIKDVIGHVVGFSGRKIFEDSGDSLKGKYVNSPENVMFNKSEVLFCEDIAKNQAGKDNEIYVVEGQFDAIAMQHIGKTNVVASSGTAFTTQHVNLLRRFVGPSGKIVFCFDADAAGQKAALRVFKTLGSAQNQAYAVITKDKDPSDMYKDDPESLKQQISSLTPLWKHVLMFMVGKYDMSDESQRLKFLEEAREVHSTIKDLGVSDSFRKLASLESSIPIDVINGKFEKIESQNASNKVLVDDIKLSDGFEALVDNILALSVEEPSLRLRLNEVNLRGSQHERFGKWLKYHTDERIVPEMFAGTPGEDYMRKLMVLSQRFHEYDGAYGSSDPHEVFDQQKNIINKEQRRITLQSYLARMSQMSDSTNPEVLAAFSDKMHEITANQSV